MWIRKEADIEDQVGILWDSLPETETNGRNQNAFLGGLLVKTLVNVGAQLVHIEFRRIDHEV